ncbi:hypothetical protein QAD02_011739 [Eretmocerus hayati]|uniref:Uncharacterized protein n=1 Tax=Eretmocerus hayati TaxID=131215 RepID=A0ACC2NXL3_9HYME|nr:hypothetical protein QAD02_011739 [Eretmocerus hayati]
MTFVFVIVSGEEETITDASWSLRMVFYGRKASITSFPYFVAVESRWVGQIGGGSIISQRFVITAAHVFDPLRSARNYLIRAGSDLPNKGGSKHSLEYFEIHPKYVSDDGAGGTINDIALARVETPFKFDNTRKPIPLYNFTEKIKTGTPATVVGLGYTEKGLPNQLRSTTVFIADKAKCHKAWTQVGSVSIPKNSLCAGDGNSKRDTCNGDSGGPLVVNGSLVGITSFGFARIDKFTGEIECGHPKFPGVYTEVSKFHSWIKKHLEPSDEE